MDVESDSSPHSFSEEKSRSLQLALSALSSEAENFKILQNIKICMEFLSMFSISNVEKQLLQWVMPALKKTIQKAFDDNFLLSDTCEDEFILNVLGENLKLILQLLQVLKEILEYIVQYSKMSLCDVKNVALTSVQVISSTFDHCRKSAEPLKRYFNADLINIFRTMQDIHPLYFQLLEHCEIVADLEDKADIDILLEVLDNLCTISENLFFLNIKSLTINWKGYLATVQKFSDALKDRVDLKKPVTYLTSVICDNLSSIKGPDVMELSSTQIIQLSGFLVKVVLKLYGAFWEYRNKFINDIMEFCCTIYSFTPQKFVMMEHPLEISKLIDETIFVHIRQFVLTLFLDESFPQVIINQTFLSDKYRFGFLNLLNTCMEIVALNEEDGKCNLELLVTLVFQCFKMCHEEFFWPVNIFDDLVINISAAIMTHERSYEKIERILLENILQEEILNYLLATEIWCLLLSNSNPLFCADNLTNLIKIHSQLDFGSNTYRLEHIYLSSLIERIYRILPEYLKCKFGENVDNRIWKIIGLNHIPKQVSGIRGIYSDTLEKIEKLKRGDFGCKDLVNLAENFKNISTVNYGEMNIPYKNLLDAMENVWKMELTDTTNNLFRYFIVWLCKITSNFIMEFNNTQLYMILNQLTQLSSIDCLKIHICFTLKHFCYINDNQLGQDGCRIYKIFSNILSNLLLTSNNIVKQTVLEVLEILTQKGKYDVVRDVLSGCGSDNYIQGIISNFLRKKIDKVSVRGTYFINLNKAEQKHVCVDWKKGENDTCKKIKLDIIDTKDCQIIGNVPLNEVVKLQDRNINIPKGKVKVKSSGYKYKLCEKEKSAEEILSREKSEDDDNVDEILSRIKGELKCLMNVLKTEKLNPKNAADIKIISNQLLSLICP